MKEKQRGCCRDFSLLLVMFVGRIVKATNKQVSRELWQTEEEDIHSNTLPLVTTEFSLESTSTN